MRRANVECGAARHLTPEAHAVHHIAGRDMGSATGQRLGIHDEQVRESHTAI
jgi:hypothetical protein